MKILGLDIGTNSISWSVLDKDASDNYNFYEHEGKIMAGVMIFEDVLNDQGQTGAAERREHRHSRVQYFRRKLRKYNVLKVLLKHGMVPLTEKDLHAWRKSGFKQYPSGALFIDWLRTDEESNKNPYYFRAKFVEKKYDWENNQQLKYELGRAFYHLAQRRGFKSNRLDQSDDIFIEKFKNEFLLDLEDIESKEELADLIKEKFDDFGFENVKNSDLDDTEKRLKKIYDQIIKVCEYKPSLNLCKSPDNIENLIQEIKSILSKKENLGKIKQAIYELEEKLDKSGLTLGQYFWKVYQEQQKNPNAEKIRGQYTDREKHYVEEFNKICEVQEIPENLRKALYDAIFFQRPLKSQRGKVGYCLLEKKKLRSPVSHPLYEKFRILQFINNIKIKENKDEELRFLNDTERKKALEIIDNHKTLDVKKLMQKLYPEKKIIAYVKDSNSAAHLFVNYKPDHKIRLNKLRYYLKKYLGDRFGQVYRSIRHKKTKSNEIFYEDVYYEEIAWHALFTFDKEEKLKSFAMEKLGMEESVAEKFSRLNTDQGYGKLSLKAIKKIIPWLEKGFTFDKAVFAAKIPDILGKKKWEENKIEIEEGLRNLFHSVKQENFIIYIVNSIIDKYRYDGTKYSTQAEEIFYKDVKRALINNIGKVTWEKKRPEEKEFLIEKVFDILITHLKKYQKSKVLPFVERINLENRIKAFLSGENEYGVVYCENKDKLNQLYNPNKLEQFTLVYDKKTGKEILGLPFIKSVNNPTFNRVMFNLRKLINQLIIEGVIDNKTRVHIEMAREINSYNKKKAIERWQHYQEELKQEAIKRLLEFKRGDQLNDDDVKRTMLAMEQRFEVSENEIKDYIKRKKNNKTTQKETDKIIDYIKEKGSISDDDIKKILLWQEQNFICVYTGKQIGVTDIIGPNPKFDFEHTIPRSRSWDNSLENLTVADLEFNRKIKGNKIPSELPEDVYKKVIQRAKWIYEKRYKELDKQISEIKIPKLASVKKRNEAIQKKYFLEMKRDYFYKKYKFFTLKEVPEGFKRSQLNDTRLITKVALSFLGSFFRDDKTGNSLVFPVNAKGVAFFRNIWMGKDFEKKRDTHFHHLIDATITAAINKKLYQKLEEIWKEAENKKMEENEIRKKIANEKPWKTFTEDLLKLEKRILVYHQYKDSTGKQTKKKLRKRNRIIWKQVKTLPASFEEKIAKGIYKKGRDFRIEEKDGIKKFYIPLYQQGDTARGALHEATPVGAIILPGNKNKIITYVKRLPISEFLKNQSAKNPKEIIDPVIREIITKGKGKYKKITQEINKIKGNKKITQLDDESKTKVEQLIKERDEIFTLNGKKIKKIRTKIHHQNKVFDIKTYPDVFLSDKPYKQNIYFLNDKNYGVILIENEKGKRKFYPIKLFDYYKLRKSNSKEVFGEMILDNKLYKPVKFKGKPVIFKEGMKVLLLQNTDEEPEWENDQWLFERLYKIERKDDQSIKLLHHFIPSGSKEKINQISGNKQKIKDLQTEMEKRGIDLLGALNEEWKNYPEDKKAKADLSDIGGFDYNLLLKIIETNEKAKLSILEEIINQVIKKVDGLKTINLNPKSNIKTGNYVLNNPSEVLKYPFIYLTANDFKALIEGIHFEQDILGRIWKLD